jgi:MFS family permease
MTVLACAFALCGSQIYPLLYLTVATTIADSLGAPDKVLWLLAGGIIACGALAPFVGPLADMFGRKIIFIVGLALSVVGSIVCAATPTVGGFITGQVIMGFGAITQELMAIAIVAESVPTAKRPLYSAIILMMIIPWSPGTLYANWVSEKSWRWIGCILAIWNVITIALVIPFYHPPPRVNSLGLTRREQLRRIDFTGGAILTAALVLFLLALSWGGQDYEWTDARVLSTMIIGIALFFVFAAWEMWGCTYPLFPRRIIHVPRAFFAMIFVIFAAGINYVPLVVFWPIESIAVFQSKGFHTGVNTLPLGTCILGGAIISSILIGIFKKRVTMIMTIFCIMQTVGKLPLLQLLSPRIMLLTNI